MLKVEDLRKVFGGTTALHDVSFELKENETVGLLGPNGAGKTTLMNIISGYRSPTAGRVSVDGFDTVEDPLEARTRIGYMPEQPPLYDDMTVSEYLSFAASLKGARKKDIQRELPAILKKTRLEQVKGRLIGNLSKGFRQRVGLAQALIGDPELLILDEPTAGMDPIQIADFREVVRGLKSRHTILFSSHILSEVEALCDRVLILSDGRLTDPGQVGGRTRAYRALILGPEKAVLREARRVTGLSEVKIEAKRAGLEGTMLSFVIRVKTAGDDLVIDEAELSIDDDLEIDEDSEVLLDPDKKEEKKARGSQDEDQDAEAAKDQDAKAADQGQVPIEAGAGEDGPAEPTLDARRRFFYAMAKNNWPIVLFEPIVGDLEAAFEAATAASRKEAEVDA